jgi:hypothetical protein
MLYKPVLQVPVLWFIIFISEIPNKIFLGISQRRAASARYEARHSQKNVTNSNFLTVGVQKKMQMEQDRRTCTTPQGNSKKCGARMENQKILIARL